MQNIKWPNIPDDCDHQHGRVCDLGGETTTVDQENGQFVTEQHPGDGLVRCLGCGMVFDRLDQGRVGQMARTAKERVAEAVRSRIGTLQHMMSRERRADRRTKILNEIVMLRRLSGL